MIAHGFTRGWPAEAITLLKGRTFRCAVKVLIFVITSGRTGVPDKRRFCACWGKVQPARDLLFRLFQLPCRCTRFLSTNDNDHSPAPRARKMIAHRFNGGVQ